MPLELDAAICLPTDGDRGTLVGRAWVPGQHAGPSVVVIENGQVHDVSATIPTIAHLLESEAPVEALRAAPRGAALGGTDALLVGVFFDNLDFDCHPAPHDLGKLRDDRDEDPGNPRCSHISVPSARFGPSCR